MKELFREQDITRVSYYQMVLEGEGIPTMIRNEYLTCAGLTEIPIPEFFPALCVTDDTDYERAVRIIRSHLKENEAGSDKEVACKACGEINPGNFDVCWSLWEACRRRDSRMSRWEGSASDMPNPPEEFFAVKSPVCVRKKPPVAKPSWTMIDDLAPLPGDH